MTAPSAQVQIHCYDESSFENDEAKWHGTAGLDNDRFLSDARLEQTGVCF